MNQFLAVVGEYEDRKELGVFDTLQEAYAAIGQYAVEQQDWLRHQTFVEEV